MKKIYQDEIEKYDYLYDKTEYNIENLNDPRFILAQKLIKSISNVKKVLDAGIGRGTYYNLLKKQYNTFGLEASKSAIDKYHSFDNKVKNIIISDIPENYSKEEFDVVNCLEVIEHIPPSETIKNIEALHYATKKYVITSVANHEDIIDGRNVHINLRQYSEWDDIFRNYFNIIEKIEIHDGRSCIYLLEKKGSEHFELQYHSFSQPLISILMPAYNQANLIGMSIDSVVNQTYDNWELIIANDGSTDNTQEIIEKYARTDSRIKIFKKENGGPSSALNVALQNSTGDWICWLSSDDLFEPNALEIMNNAIKNNPNFQFFHFDYATIQDNQTIEQKTHHNRNRIQYDPTEEFQTLNFLQNNYVHGIAWTANKEVFNAIGNFDENIRFASDFDMWLRISSKYKLKYIDEIVAITREHSGADTSIFQNGGFYDSAVSILNFLNNNKFENLVPNIDLSQLNGVVQATQMAINVAINVDAFMYRGIGYVPALIDRLNEWMSNNIPNNILDWIYFNLIIKIIPEIQKFPLPERIKQSFNKLLKIKEVKYTYSKYEPYQEFENNLKFLQSIKQDIGEWQKKDEIEYFLKKVQKNGKNNCLPNKEINNIQIKHEKEKDLISIITPTIANHLPLLEITIRSVLSQTYSNWEMIIINDGGTNISDFINSFNDNRLIYIHKAKNEERSTARNTGLKIAKGKYICYLDDDDKFYQNHLEILYNNLNNSEYKIAYTDSIKVTQRNINGKYEEIKKELIYSNDFDYDEILIGNFIPINCVMHEKECTNTLGGFDENINMHEDYELWLRLSRKYKFKHIKQITCEYTYRESESNTSYHQREAMFETLKYVYNKHSKEANSNHNILAKRNNNLNYWRYEIEQLKQSNLSNTKPLISIIIPVLNNIDYTLNCIKSIYDTAEEIPFEIIIIDNNSEQINKEKLANIQKEKKNLKVIYNEINETYSKANNQGAQIAEGKYLLFLNNDTQLFENTLKSIINTFENEPKIGIQGGKLLYPNNTIQHCGIVFGELAPNINLHYHIYLCYPSDATNVNFAREYQMVTGALLVIRKDLFKKIGGFDENYIFGHEDLDICMKVRESGYKVWYNPTAVAYHFESVTKKLQGIEKFERFLTNPNSFDAKNDRYFHSKWDKVLKNDADDYYIQDGVLDKVKDKSKLHKFYNIQNKEATNKPRILFTMYGWNESGGGTMFPKSVCKELVKNGIEIASFYATEMHPIINEPYYLEKKEEDGVLLYGVYNRPTVFLDVNEPSREIKDENILKLFNKVLDEYKPDIVHFQNFLGLSFAMAEETKKRGIPSLYTPHNYHLIDPALYMINSDMQKWHNVDLIECSEYVQSNLSKRNDYIRRKEAAKNLLNNNIDYTLAVSTRVKDLLSELSGNLNDNIFVVNQVNPITQKLYNTITKDSNQIHKPIKFGFIGSVIPHKGIHNIVLAAQLIPKDKATFFIYGGGNENYINSMREIDKVQNINWMGSYKLDELPEIAHNLDVAIVPSIWEDCAPLVIAENLAMKLPVIGADIGGIRDFVKDDYNGKLYDYASTKDLANIIIDIINDPSLIKKWRDNIELNITFESFVQHTIKIYQNLFKNRKLSKNETELFYLKDNKFISNNNSKNAMKSLRNTINQISKQTQSSKPKEIQSVASENSNEPMNRLKFDNNLNHGFSNYDAKGNLPSTLPSPLFLNLGCGKDVRDGFLNLDLFSDDPNVIKMDIRKLEFSDNIVDLILASDVLEHFSHRETDIILKEWARVLKPNGEIIIRCPSLSLQLKAYSSGAWDADIASYMIFGGQTNPGDYHCIGFDKQSIYKHLQNAGFSVTHFEELDIPQDRGYINLNMEVRAIKV